MFSAYYYCHLNSHLFSQLSCHLNMSVKESFIVGHNMENKFNKL